MSGERSCAIPKQTSCFEPEPTRSESRASTKDRAYFLVYVPSIASRHSDPGLSCIAILIRTRRRGNLDVIWVMRPQTCHTNATTRTLPALVQEQALDSTGKPHHQYEFLDPYFVEGQHVTVHSVAHVPGRYLAVVS